MAGGVGIDLVEVARIRRLIDRSPAFFTEYFGEPERRACAATVAPQRRFAAALAAKEAFVKALGRGVLGSVALREVEVAYDDGMPPALRLGQSARGALAAAGWADARLTLCCDGARAMAFVILTKSPGSIGGVG